MTKVLIIGSGFAGLSAACCLAAEGMEVEVFEKNDQPGGRARLLETGGFKFDMGPSWYWMPDVFERFFNNFGKRASDYYDLKKLDPSYSVFFEDAAIEIPSGEQNVIHLFETIEKGAGDKLYKFLREAEYKYQVGIEELVYKPSLSYLEFADWRLAKSSLRLDVFNSLSSHVKKYFKNPKLIQLLEFPVLFLGAMPSKIPALYSLMNYADITLGTWYPMGGMYKVVEGMTRLAESLGVKFYLNSQVDKILVNSSGESYGINVTGSEIKGDVIIGGADYHHVEQNLLEKNFRTYSENYWDSKTLAPSCLIFYVGLNKKLKKLTHHNLFFDADFTKHAEEIYLTKEWPSNPLFYVCCPSKTDGSVAPPGCENLFVLIPTAVGLSDNEELREKYFQLVMKRMEKVAGESIIPFVQFKKSYAGSDFVSDYNSYKGNAYGLANTLSQTAILRPSIKSKKVKNLYYTGQLTVPGPGVPPALISGQVVATQIFKDLNQFNSASKLFSSSKTLKKHGIVSTTL